MSKSGHPRINVTFDPETYDQIRLLAHKEGKSMSEIIRQWVYERLNGELTRNNIDFISRIIREQLKNILQPSTDRLAAISAKGSLAAITAAYLSAETIARFVPEELQEDVREVYMQARKKAVIDMHKRPETPEGIE